VTEAVFWIPCRRRRIKVYMLAVIGNVVVGVLAISLFTATIRLSR
jgi:hypothetical protein